MTRKDKSFSRREMLKSTAGARRRPDTDGAHPGPRAPRRRSRLNMWWWGEQELPGLQGYVDEAGQRLHGSIRQADAAGYRGRHFAVPDRRSGRQGARHPVSLERHLPYGKRVARLLAPARRADQRRHHQSIEPDPAQPFRRQDLSRRLVSVADDLDLQQGPVRQGRSRCRQSAQDLG